MSQAKPCIEYDPACVECRRDAGKDAAGTTWQCVGHVCLERDALRELMNVYNIGGWTDALVPVQRALKAEAERDAALAERDAARTEVYSLRQMVETWHVRAEAHRQANEATTQALTEARRVLREAEWGKSSEWCCICLNHECHGHSPDCALAAVLAQEEK